jgi:hypothetical protein
VTYVTSVKTKPPRDEGKLKRKEGHRVHAGDEVTIYRN